MNNNLIDKVSSLIQLKIDSTEKIKNNFENLVYNEGYDLSKPNLYIESASGAYIKDIDSNEYIDMTIGAGSNILGHASPVITQNIKEQIDKGSIYTIPNLYTHKLTKILKEAIPHYDGFVYCNSGSEATLRAMRIARAYTGKTKIAIFSGSWHGTHDNALVSDDFRTDKDHPKGVLLSEGIPQDVLNHIVIVPYNEESSFNLLEQHKGELAMVLIEPSQGSNPRDDMQGYLLRLKEFCVKNNILLGFDEIITGFRVAFGGAQEYYGIEADIATYGKTAGGGFPIGIVGGKKSVMDTIKAKGIYMGGTYSANPITMCAGYSLMKYISDHKNTFYKTLDQRAKTIKNTINNFCIENSIPVRIYGISSMLRLIFTSYNIHSRWDRDHQEIPQDLQAIFYNSLLADGIYIAGNRILFLSIEHTDEIVNKFITVTMQTLQKMKTDGVFKEERHG